MEGVQFVIDERGERTAVLIDLREYGEVWEDFYDRLVAESRRDEPRELLETVKNALRAQRQAQWLTIRSPSHGLLEKSLNHLIPTW